VTTERDFYLYFPFFLSNFGDFKEVQDTNIAQLLEEIDSSPNASPEIARQVWETLEQSSVDSFIRTFGQGNVPPIFVEIQPMPNKIREAQMSNHLYKLYNRLS
jgi:hypothetical protein